MTMLMAFDGRPHTEKALEYAIRHSRTFSDSLCILSVVTKADQIRAVREINASAVERARDAGVDARGLVESGSPEKVIIETAGRFGCSTLIVGRSSRTTFDRVVLGSVSNYAVANAKCTVIVVQ